MRPSSYGGAIQSSVYEVKNDTEELVGIVSAKSKVAHNVPSGEHLFMVVSEGADFMSATVEAGKTYHVLVAPRVGFWKARFSLIPIHNDPAEKYNINGSEFAGWNSSTQFVELKDSGREWYRQNAADIARKRKNHLERWNALSAENKARKILYASDGVAQKTP